MKLPKWVDFLLAMLVLAVVLAVGWKMSRPLKRKADEEFCARLASVQNGHIVTNESAPIVILGFPDSTAAGQEEFKIIWADSIGGGTSFIVGQSYEVALNHTKATFYSLRSIDLVDDCSGFTRLRKKLFASFGG